MELYAGMVENMDHHIGRLIEHLKKIGEYDNTLFVFFGDMSTVSDTTPTDLRMDGFMLTLVFGWHPLVEGARRLESE